MNYQQRDEIIIDALCRKNRIVFPQERTEHLGNLPVYASGKHCSQGIKYELDTIAYQKVDDISPKVLDSINYTAQHSDPRMCVRDGDEYNAQFHGKVADRMYARRQHQIRKTMNNRSIEVECYSVMSCIV